MHNVVALLSHEPCQALQSAEMKSGRDGIVYVPVCWPFERHLLRRAQAKGAHIVDGFIEPLAQPEHTPFGAANPNSLEHVQNADPFAASPPRLERNPERQGRTGMPRAVTQLRSVSVR